MSRDAENVGADTLTESPQPENTENTVPEAQSGEQADESATGETGSAESTEKQEAGESDKTGEAGKADEKPAGPTEEQIKAALEAFQKLATEAEYDSATGELPGAELAKIKAAYAELPSTPAKTQARKWLSASMRDALAKERNPSKARAFLAMEEEVKTTAATRETIARPPQDPTQAHVERVGAMYLASSFVDPGSDVAEDWISKVQDLARSLAGEVGTYKAFLAQHDAWTAADEATRGEEPKAPEVSGVVLNAAKIARGRGIGTGAARRASTTTSAPRATGPGYSGPRRDVKKHIASAFADVPVGTFLKVAEIAGHKSDEYGDDRPSSGAISASLASAKFDVDGVQPTESNGLKGARKVA
jgi:hypothetical protein